MQNLNLINIKNPNYLHSTVRSIHSLGDHEPIPETMLIQAWLETQDRKALEKLLLRHKKLVQQIAYRYRGYGLPPEDLIAEGYIGIMQAIKGFDAQKGFKFNTYARWWIKAAIQQFVMKNWSLVKIGTTGHQKRLFFNLSRLKRNLGAETLDDAQLLQLSEKTNIPIREIQEMEKRMARQDESLNQPAYSGDEGETEWQSLLEADGELHDDILARHQELMLQHEILKDSLVCLSKRERYIISQRRLADPIKRLEDLAEELGLTKQRVHQIELAAFEKLRKEATKIAKERLVTPKPPQENILSYSLSLLFNFFSPLLHKLFLLLRNSFQSYLRRYRKKMG